MPDIPAGIDSAHLLIVRRDLDPVQDPLCRHDLVRAHDHEHLLRCEDAVLRQDIQERVPRKERAREIHQVSDDPVVRVRPE